MTYQRMLRVCTGAVLLSVIAIVTAINGINLMEAYGSGAPYYSRTTNMDKWTDPVPALFATDSVTVSLAVGYVIWLKRKNRS